MTLPDALPIARTSRAGALLHAEGEPVWPVHDDVTLRALEELATTFGTRTVSVPHAQAGRSTARSGLVVALGPEAHEIGALYANLTQRAVVALDAERDCLARRDVDVIVAAQERLSSAFLEELYGDSSRACAPGIITGTTPAGLLRQALLRSAAVRLEGAFAEPRVDFAAASQDVTAAGVEADLREPPELVTYLGHSDGLDAKLGELVLCAVQDRLDSPDPDRERLPACVRSGNCHRTFVAIEVAKESGRLLSPRVFRGRVCLFVTCWGMRTEPSFVSLQWTLFDAMMENPKIGAMVTSWKLIHAHRGFIETFHEALANGHSIGTAVAIHNRDPGTRALGAYLGLFGDPAIRCPALGPPRPKAAPAPATGGTQPDRGGPAEYARLSAALDQLARSPDGQGVEFLAMWLREKLDGLAARAGKSDIRDEARRGFAHSLAVTELAGLRLVDWRRTPGDATKGRLARRAFITACAEMGDTPSQFTMSRSRIELRGRDADCTCGAPTELFSVTSSAARRMRICTNCGFVEDAPWSADANAMQLSEDLTTIRIVGEVLDYEVGVIALVTRARAERKVHAWPVDDSGRLAKIIHLAEPPPSGPLFLVAMAMRGHDIVTLNCALPIVRHATP